MTITNMPPAVAKLNQLRAEREVLDLDIRRTLNRVRQMDRTQREIADWTHIAQPTLSGLYRTAEKVADPLDGFSGATPMEICLRYAAGELEQEQLVDELARFPYADMDAPDDVDGLTVNPAGTWSEVVSAKRRGLIDAEIYAAVFERLHGSAAA
ncbi:hypothetical protein [Pseudoclavibacter sp. RFBA6]|uniref:hypothetical protein n=1 Tax=Pseudoclavibacter sp. RFBA6 TaxID=2080573 RepID=UPI000CE80C7C|nr:hypothetical protein [Pseudoclavibacter sp. RFBA6]PPG43725.1 hypothetical protein C5C17_00375 [Pseudoclavibacter sp. RFBA6]